MIVSRPLAIASSLILANCGDSGTSADTSTPDADVTNGEVQSDVDAETSPLCCPIAAEPSCDCFEVGGSGDNGCYAICDAIPVGWTRTIDENGCPIWTGGEPGSCLPHLDAEVSDDTETSDDTSTPDTSDTTPGDTPDGDVGPPPEDPLGLRFTLSGSVQIVETYSSGAGEPVGSWIFVDLRDAPLPLPYLARAEDGACKVWTLSDTPCDPSCEPGQICDATGTCRDYPSSVTAGQLLFEGLATSITAHPTEFGGYTFIPEPPADLFAAGAAITVAAEGSASHDRFTAGVTGVADLAIEGTGLVELVDGQPTTLTWAPAGDDSIVEVVLQLGWHGAPATGVIVCRAPDSAGEIVISPDVIAPFPYFTFGLFQAPSWIERLTRTLIPTDGGPLEITASSRVNLGVTHSP